ncbi:hypothetical protein [Hymenobacter glacieicola]|uniref:Uncharacterized protein n=1 Tax=Hymenobacter glacieicola TaxID=1562124 RepID=A0ABQ1X5I8_9BACT|nr:hypothetical protein [Hymenobacter glacieicola]GGG60966.1 hypothetical protein GCM10011378_41220 [Hymenobacter glacieicola]
MKFIVPNHSHVTATERKAIAQMIAQGLTNARNKPNTKAYEVVSGGISEGAKRYKVRIATREKRWIGAEIKWHFSNCEVELPATN